MVINYQLRFRFLWLFRRLFPSPVHGSQQRFHYFGAEINRMSKKTIIKLVFGVILTAVILYFSIYSLKGLHISVILHTGINWFLVLLSILVFIYANYIRGFVYTRGIDKQLDRITAFRIVGIGHAINMVMPLRLGEGLRYVFFPAEYSASKRAKLLIIPAFTDFVVIMAISVLAVPFAGFRDRAMILAMWILCGLCVAGILLCVLAIFFVPAVKRYLAEYLNFSLVKMLGWVFLSWVLLLFSTWIGLVAIGYGELLTTARMSIAIFAATNIINFIPASPGSLGLFEYATVLAMSIFHIDQSHAFAASLLLHLIQYAALMPLGVVLYFSAIHGKYGEQIRGAIHKGHRGKP
jgi:Predicted integral membrane protein